MVPELYWRCGGVVPELYRYCTGVVPELYRNCAGVVSELYRICGVVGGLCPHRASTAHFICKRLALRLVSRDAARHTAISAGSTTCIFPRYGFNFGRVTNETRARTSSFSTCFHARYSYPIMLVILKRALGFGRTERCFAI